MDSLLRNWDGEEVVIRYDQPTGAWIVIAIHSTRLGPSGGGTRMKPYPDLDAAVLDAIRLAEGMTHKYASVNFPYGGAKGVIAIPADLRPEDRPDLLRRYGSLIRDLGGLFTTGPDVGTSSADMDVIGETAGKLALCQDPARGGAGDPGPQTALGVFEGMRAACEQVFGSDDLGGRTVVVQGAGDVGGPLIELCAAAGAEVKVADLDGGRCDRYRATEHVEIVDATTAAERECDVFAPCALGAVLNEDTIPRLRCRIVAGSANNQLRVTEDGRRLQDRRILYAPDYVINAGGAIAIWGMEVMGWSVDEARTRLVSLITTTLRDIFDASNREGITTERAAERIVAERLKTGKVAVAV